MSEIKVNKISPRTACGTVTLGDSGDTIALGTGASQTGFGRTGTVDWQTGSIKTGDFTAVNTQGFFVDTNGGAVTATLPSGSAGAIISFQDYRNTFDTHALTVTPASGEKINGGAGNIVLNTEGEGVTLVYIDSTVGWRSIQDNVFADVGSNFITATGGTETTSGDDKIHTFTGPGTFTVTGLAACAANNIVSHLVVAGGGGGGTGIGGGGGAGGFREVKNPATPYTASPLDGYPTPGNRVTVTATAFPITVGGGGAGGAGTPGDARCGHRGNPSIFSTITSTGGGGGGGNSPYGCFEGPGGSGGAAVYNSLIKSPTTGGVGNTPPVSPSQGFPGGNGSNPTGAGNPSGPPCAATTSGGGGGATEAGENNYPRPSPAAGKGGDGATTSISATPTVYAGGGGGVFNTSGAPGPGGTGGGGAGAPGPSGGGAAGVAGGCNTGGGGGGSGDPAAAGNGGSGIVIIRYKFQ
jgi:hypothetical protein